MTLQDLTAYLDEYLDIHSVTDYPGAYNGLQVEGTRDIQRVAFAVDVAQVTIDKANEGVADLLIVHHGLFWGSIAPVTGAYYKRLSALIKSGLALYSSHLPLDVHPEVGNNHVLARKLGLDIGGRFGNHEGVEIGVWADVEMQRNGFVSRVKEVLRTEPNVIAKGPSRTQRIGIITGGAGSMIKDAQAAGCDTFLTGEGPHHTYFEAEEREMNVIYAGHYATETIGVQALATHLHQRFSLETFFIDHPTGL